MRQSKTPLEKLGLTGLEAEIYRFLLANGPGSGYRIAKGIAKPTANTYKALASLQSKAVIVPEVDGGKKRHRALPAADVLEMLAERLNEDRQNAATELANIKTNVRASGRYQLYNRRQVLARLRHVIEAATKSVVVDASGKHLAEISETLEATAARGVVVLVLCDEPWHSKHVRTVVKDKVNASHERIMLVADKVEMVTASNLHNPRAVHAEWAQDESQVHAGFSGLCAEVFFAQIQAGLQEGINTDELEEAFEAISKLRTS